MAILIQFIYVMLDYLPHYIFIYILYLSNIYIFCSLRNNIQRIIIVKNIFMQVKVVLK